MFTKRALRVGMPAPEFMLQSAHGEIISLADYKRRSPLLLLFFHGTQCRFCKAEIEELGRRYRELAATGVPMAAILPEDKVRIYTDLGVTTYGFPLLQDPDRAVARRYGVYRLLAREGWGVTRPALFLIDIDGFICWVQRPERHQDWPRVPELAAVIRRALRRR
jgi:thioredoxin-dependent peroxiredoxin